MGEAGGGGIAVLAGLVLVSAAPVPARSDTPPPGQGVAVDVAELVVTGTRLPTVDLSVGSPIVAVDEKAIRSRGALTTEAVLNRLPQVVPSFSSAANNPSANGAAYVNLRGLGEGRNLVLLDGRRVIGGDASNAVDLNTIPPGLIDRIEIITGGASAVYGADAVAGVVNIILKDRFKGLEISTRHQISERGDGREDEVSVLFGQTTSRASLTGAFTWGSRAEIGKGARVFSAQPDAPSSYLPGGSYFPGPNPPSRAAIDAVFGAYGVGAGEVFNRGGLGGFGFNADGTLFATGIPNNPGFDVQNYRGPMSNVATKLFPDVYTFNYQPFNKLILPLDRETGALFGTYDLTDRFRLYAQALFTHYEADTALAPTPAPTDPNLLYPGQNVLAFTIPVTNPFIPKDLATLLASRTGDAPALPGSGASEDFLYKLRTVALGPRQSANRSDSVNVTGGLKADLGRTWRADAYVTYGAYSRSETQTGLLAVARLQALLNSPSGGADLCPGGFDPFGVKLGDGCARYLSTSARYATSIQMTDAVLSASGDTFRLPAGPARVAVGAEYRGVGYRFAPPAGLIPGEVAGFIPYTAVDGSIRTGEVFAEVALPLAANRPLIHALDLTLGYRRGDEGGGGGGADSFKAEVGWALTPALRLRGSAQRAVRAPNIFERYEAPVGNEVNAIDPCAQGPLRAPAVLALCRAQAAGLGFDPQAADDLTQDDPSAPVTQSGNRSLKAERATTYTLGVVWRPAWENAWVGRLEATVDGYSIRIANAIDYEDAQILLDDCYLAAAGTDPAVQLATPACRAIQRSGVDFSLASVDTPRTNQSSLGTAGIDAGLAFRTDVAALTGRGWLGRLDTHLSVSWLAFYHQRLSAIEPTLDFAGTIAASDVGYLTLPRWKGLLDLDWTSGPVGLSLSGRFIDGMENRIHRIDPTADATGVGPAWYWDLSAVWSLGRRLELRAGVQNLFDRGPELYRPNVDAGTEPSTYDVIGRRYWMGLTARW